jgi:hypothetical protein
MRFLDDARLGFEKRRERLTFYVGNTQIRNIRARCPIAEPCPIPFTSSQPCRWPCTTLLCATFLRRTLPQGRPVCACVPRHR